MHKDFKSKMKESQKKHEEEKKNLEKELDKERHQLKEERKSMEREVCTCTYIYFVGLQCSSKMHVFLYEMQIQRQVEQLHETEKKRLVQEIHVKSSQLKAVKKSLQDVQAADHAKAELIHEMNMKHRTDLEGQSQASRRSSRQQVTVIAIPLQTRLQ